MSELTGTIETEAIIGAAQTRMAKSLQEYQKAYQQIEQLPNLLSEFTLKITQAEVRLNQLKADYDEKRRQFRVELELEKKQSIENVVMEYLAGEQKIAVKHADYETLRENLKKATTDQETVVKAEVAKAVGAVEAKHKAAAEVREAEYRAKEADNRAQITSLTNQVNTLSKEIDAWKIQLNEERKASVDRAKASSVGSINVSSPGK